MQDMPHTIYQKNRPIKMDVLFILDIFLYVLIYCPSRFG